jgi:hypothetical protein
VYIHEPGRVAASIASSSAHADSTRGNTITSGSGGTGGSSTMAMTGNRAWRNRSRTFRTWVHPGSSADVAWTTRRSGEVSRTRRSAPAVVSVPYQSHTLWPARDIH